jgi:hypothetical protein
VKQCTKCNETKELTEFGPFAKGAGGKNARCYVCVREYNNWYYATNPKAKQRLERYKAKRAKR